MGYDPHATMIPRHGRRLVLVVAVVGLSGCARHEDPEVALARSRAEQVELQIAGLEATIARAERGELSTTGLIAIGVSEDLVRKLLNASLPLETVIADRVRVRVESAEPYFRGTRTAILFHASVASLDLEAAAASIDLGGSLDGYQLADGQLRARVGLAHFSVRESAAGELAAGALEALLRANVGAIEAAIPTLMLPVQLDQAIAVKGLTQGAVVARPGQLPLEMALNVVIVSNGRLWMLVAANPGQWQAAEPEPPTLSSEPDVEPEPLELESASAEEAG